MDEHLLSKWTSSLTDDLAPPTATRSQDDVGYKGSAISALCNRIDRKVQELEAAERTKLIQLLAADPREMVGIALASMLARGTWQWLPSDGLLGALEALGASQSGQVRQIVATALGDWADASTRLAAMAVLMGMRRAAADTSSEAPDESVKALDEALFKLSGSIRQ